MRKFVSAALLGAGLLVSAPATPQDWSPYGGDNHDHDYRGDDDEDELAQTICSGDRAQELEERLRHQEDEEEMDGREVDRIHRAIDRLEDRQHRECATGDLRAIDEIAFRYDRIARWIDGGAQARSW